VNRIAPLTSGASRRAHSCAASCLPSSPTINMKNAVDCGSRAEAADDKAPVPRMAYDTAIGTSRSRQHAANETLQVVGFGNGGVHRVIRRLLQGLQHLDIAIEVA